MAVITTVIPVYNGEPHITEALYSLARQRRRPDRVVVLDNCSTDRTREMVTGFKGLRCEYRLNERNLGLFGNHNRALELAAETDYLHFLHTDDVLLPDFCARTIEMLNNVEGRGMSWCQAEFIDERGEPLPPIIPPISGSPERVSLDDFLKERTQLRADIFVSGTMIKTNRQPIPCRFRETSSRSEIIFSGLSGQVVALGACECGRCFLNIGATHSAAPHLIRPTWTSLFKKIGK